MNTKQIIAELRRSAVEDVNPWRGCDLDAMDEAIYWKDSELFWLFDMRRNDLRTFYLLVAEAMESE